jgi:magnesium transporter
LENYGHVTDQSPVLSAAPARLLSGAVEQHLTAQVPVCGPTDTAAEIRAGMSRKAFRSAVDIAVCDHSSGRPRRLSGLIPVERILKAADQTPAQAIMDPDPPVVSPGLDQEKAAWEAVRHGESSLAVVDSAGMFRGLVPPGRLLGVLLREHDEDLARLGGYLSSTASARHATEEPLSSRLSHRLP